jgi:hypothetical protein
MRLGRAGFLLTLFALAPAALKAQAPPLGVEVPANSYTTNSQSVPAIASDGIGGNFVVVWDSFSQDGDSDGIFGRLFGFAGLPAATDFQVNTYTTNSQDSARVAMNGSGNFVVVWRSSGQDGSQGGIFGQRFDHLGAKVGSEFQVNTHTTYSQTEPDVAMDDAGEFVVVWTSFGQDGYAYGVFGQRFTSAGAKAGPEFPVNTHTTGDQVEPAVAMSGGGNFVVVWESYDQDGSGGAIFGQRYDAGGTRLGGEFAVNSYTTNQQTFPTVATNRHGDFVVAWSSNGEDEDSYGIFMQLFNSGGEKFGSERIVNEHTAQAQEAPSVSMASDGSFVVTWQSYLQDGSSWGIYGKQFDRLAGALGFEFPINISTAGAQQAARVADNGVDGFVAAWQAPDGSGDGVITRRQALVPAGVSVDAHAGTGDLNGVLEPGEAVYVEPRWFNYLAGAVLLDGNATDFYGAAGPTYTLLDGAASYGAIPGITTGSCNGIAPSGCYAVQATGTRPGTHWDTAMPENVSWGGTHYWILHVGDSFSDVPRSQPFYKKIETMLHAGITSGCTATEYCPGNVVSRDQMAIFIAKSIAGAAPLIPVAGTISGQPYNCSPGGASRFTDVAPTDSFCKQVHYLALQNVTLGCNGTQYCPGQAVTRDAMASFIAKAIVAPKGGSAVPASYTDPTTARTYSCVSGSPNLHFTDVPVSSPFCKHIHYLWAKGIVDGCSATTYCPGQPVARDAMAKFIANGFGLQLYGP